MCLLSLFFSTWFCPVREFWIQFYLYLQTVVKSCGKLFSTMYKSRRQSMVSSHQHTLSHSSKTALFRVIHYLNQIEACSYIIISSPFFFFFLDGVPLILSVAQVYWQSLILIGCWWSQWCQNKRVGLYFLIFEMWILILRLQLVFPKLLRTRKIILGKSVLGIYRAKIFVWLWHNFRTFS